MARGDPSVAREAADQAEGSTGTGLK
jgi:hypothetical protein